MWIPDAHGKAGGVGVAIEVGRMETDTSGSSLASQSSRSTGSMFSERPCLSQTLR